LATAERGAARRPRLRTLLLGVNLVILLLPLAGIGVLRVYQSALVRQTESELVAQGAFVAAAYRAAFERTVPAGEAARYGLPLRAAPPLPESDDQEHRWQPRPAKLDLSTDPVLPPVPPATPAAAADRFALTVGREITALMREAQLVTLAAIRVVDPHGTVVASTGEELGLSLAAREEVKRALAGEHTSLLRERVSDELVSKANTAPRATGVRVLVATPIVNHDRVLGAVVLARTPSRLTQTLYRHRAPLLIGLGVLLAAALAVSLFTALAIARPVTAVIRQTERARRGERGAVTPLAHPVTREVAQLSEAVAEMAHTLEERADYIRNFAAHVSHEFKTPLTAMQGAIELLREHYAGMTDAERDRFLANLAADTERLDRLVRRLLELARAEMYRPRDDATAILPIIKQLFDAHRAQGGRVDWSGPLPETEVRLSADTLDAVLGNVLNNARQHGGPDVHIVVSAECRDNVLEVRISDNGPGISPANAARVFEPFFTTARNQGGTGLGLSVVKALLEAHGGSIELLPAAPGARFVIQLPLSITNDTTNPEGFQS
jgi:signal transduction histidine kinase